MPLTPRLQRILSVGLAVLFMGAVACSNGTDEAGDDPGGSTTTFVVETDEGTQAFGSDDDQGSFSFETDDGKGSLTFDLDGDGVVAQGDDGTFELANASPAGWPADFPVPGGAEVVGGNVVTAGPLRQLTTVYRNGMPGRDVVAYYEDALADLLPLVDVRDDRDESYQASVSFEGAYTGFLTVATTGGVTELAVQLAIEEE